MRLAYPVLSDRRLPSTRDMRRALHRPAFAWALGVLGLAASTGCSVDEALLEQLPSRGRDGGTELEPADRCGVASTAFLPRAAATSIEIDTRGLTDTVSLNCPGSAATPGNDAFFALDVRELDFWHFHLTPLDDGAAHDPVLYLLRATNNVCNTRVCAGLSDECVRLGQEHFGFRATEAGIWYLGIDDKESGGARYRLEVFRPECDLGGTDHGEGCDEAGQPCDSACRYKLSGDTANENSGLVPANTPGEALVLDMGADGQIIVSGNADNDTSDDADTCSYPDYFVVDVPQDGSLEVELVDPSGVACDSAADVVPVAFELLRPTLVSVAQSSPQPVTGCPRLAVSDLDDGQYFVLVRQAEELPLNQLGYRVRVHVEGP